MRDAMLIGLIGFIIVTIISDFFMNRYWQTAIIWYNK